MAPPLLFVSCFRPQSTFTFREYCMPTGCVLLSAKVSCELEIGNNRRVVRNREPLICSQDPA